MPDLSNLDIPARLRDLSLKDLPSVEVPERIKDLRDLRPKAAKRKRRRARMGRAGLSFLLVSVLLGAFMVMRSRRSSSDPAAGTPAQPDDMARASSANPIGGAASV